MSKKVISIDAATRAGRVTGKSAKTRQMLIREALRIISEKGVQATSSVKIAQELGISPGTFYYHFQNMDHLLDEVGHSVVLDITNQAAPVLLAEPFEPGVLGTRGLLTIYYYLKEHPEMRAILLRVLLDEEGRYPDVRLNLRRAIVRARELASLPIEDVDLAVESSVAMVAAMIRATRETEHGERRATLIAAQSLMILGMPYADSLDIAEREQALLRQKLAASHQDVQSSGKRM